MRKCTKCNTNRSLQEFTKWSKNWCRACRNTYSRNYMVTTHRENARKQHLRSTYGLSLEQKEAMLVAQNYKCLICDKVKDELCVDHDHELKVNRGLLCRKCNSALGLLEDRPENLYRAFKYLEYKLAKSPRRVRTPEDVLRPVA